MATKQLSIKFQQADYVLIKKAAIIERRSISNFLKYAADKLAEEVLNNNNIEGFTNESSRDD